MTPGRRRLPAHLVNGALACGLSLLATVSARAETIDRVLAVAGGRIITLSDVTAARDLALVRPDAGADAIRAVLTQLIDRELVLTEVDRYAPPEPAADAVERELAAIRARFASTTEYEAALARSGIDDKHVRELVRQNLRIRAYQDQRFAAADPRRDALIAEWIAGLRRRGDIVDLYATGR